MGKSAWIEKRIINIALSYNGGALSLENVSPSHAVQIRCSIPLQEEAEADPIWAEESMAHALLSLACDTIQVGVGRPFIANFTIICS